VRPLNDVTAQPDDPKSQSQRSMGAATGRWPRRRCETNKATKTLPRLLIRPTKVKPPRFLQDAAFRSSQREGNQPDREIDRHTCNEYHADNSGRAPHDRVHGKGDMRAVSNGRGRRPLLERRSPALRPRYPAARVAAAERNRRCIFSVFTGGVPCTLSAWVMDLLAPLAWMRAGAEVRTFPSACFSAKHKL
jgi:hypothetical protein